MTAGPYDDALSALRNGVDDLGTWLAIWEGRTEPDAHARRCASDAVAAIDSMLGHIYGVRAQLVSEIRKSDDATAARADTLLARREDRKPR
jgi:hypothetical protein